MVDLREQLDSLVQRERSRTLADRRARKAERDSALYCGGCGCTVTKAVELVERYRAKKTPVYCSPECFELARTRREDA